MSGLLASYFENRYHPAQDPPKWMTGAARTHAGVAVTTESSLQATAVFACVRVLAESVASLPLHLFQRAANGGKQPAVDHPLYRILHDMANPEMTAMELRETLMGHLALRGNAFANIEWSNAGRPLAIWPLHPDGVRIERGPDGALRYRYRMTKADKDGNLDRILPAREVLHLRGLGANGLVGYSPVTLHLQAIGLALAAEEFGARFFGDGANPGGVLEHPKTLTDDAHDRIRKSWEEAHQGLDRSHRVAILEEGLSYKQVGIPPNQAQFLETRSYQKRDIAMIFRIPPHKIGDLERATFSNIEHQSIEFVTDTLLPWLIRWEQRISMSLLSEAERNTYYAKHNVAGLLRGDTLSRYQAYHQALTDGWLSGNEVREMEDLDPYEHGDTHLVPMNMAPIDQVIAGMWDAGAETPPTEPAAARSRPLVLENREQRAKKAVNARHRLINSHRKLYRETAGRVLRREVQDVRKQAKKLLGQRAYADFSLWLDDFYRDHEEWVRKQMLPLTQAYADLVADVAGDEVNAAPRSEELERFVRSYTASYATRHVAISAERLRKAAKKAEQESRDPLEAVEEELDAWEEQRVERIAREEPVRANNAVAKLVYSMAGILTLRWWTFGDNCPYCTNMHGRTVGMQDVFLPAGDNFQPDGADAPLNVARDVGHPPLHDGCDCMIGAG